MEKAIEIKRRAQRCIQNGDLDGALNEYEKLVGSEDSDPYNYVLLADLLYKKGDQVAASERYLSAVGAYEKATLYKNAIAVCKKMLRLSLSPAKVLQSLGNLHALDGLAGEAALYYVQFAEHMVRSSAPADAAAALRQAFDVCQDNVRVLEQLSEAWLLAGENEKAAQALVEAASHYRQRGNDADARRCTDRAAQFDATIASASEIAAPAEPADDTKPFAMARVPMPAAEPDATPAPEPYRMPEPGAIELSHTNDGAPVRAEAPLPAAPLELDRMHGLETGRHDAPAAAAPAAPLAQESAPEAETVHILDAAIGDESPVPVTSEESEDAADDDAVAEEAVTAASDDDVVIVEDDDEDDDDVAYEIEDEPEAIEEPVAEEAPVAASPAPEPPAVETPEVEAVYEIADDEVISFDAMPADEAEPVYEIAADALDTPGSTPASPGLAFAQSEPEPAPQPTHEERALADVEALLAQAQEQFRAGDRDEASHTLTRAAQAYDALEKLENAATIYRSLGKGAHATPEILELWLGNCERRHDVHEGALVACDLGDRALNDGDEHGASGWFERALALDGGNDTARRRLERLARAQQQESGAVAVATAEAAPIVEMPEPAIAPAAVAPPAPPALVVPEQRVEIAVGRAEAVSFDLAGLLAEFQRGVSEQLAGDAQSHYDLGMTYREMGLFEQAMESFRGAEQDARFAARATEMVARCLADQGRHADAVPEFQRALAMPGIGPENDLELRYHYGKSLSELGRLGDAVAEYERVVHSMPDFEDAGFRLAALRRTLGRG